jgi:hypothetical protein
MTYKETFVEKAILKHGNTYDYSKVNYINSRTKVKINCNRHGEFNQTPNGHLSGRGCSECKFEKCSYRMRNNILDFIEKAKKIHGDYYDYHICNYIGCHEKVIIVCNKHGEFFQTPNNHLSGKGCLLCSNLKQSSTTNKFIEKGLKIHSGIYDYSKVDYIKNREKVTIVCKTHGDFFQTPQNHLNGKGCKLCANESKSRDKRSNTNEFIEKSKKIHGNTYDYSKVEYKTIKEKERARNKEAYERLKQNKVKYRKRLTDAYNNKIYLKVNSAYRTYADQLRIKNSSSEIK